MKTLKNIPFFVWMAVLLLKIVPIGRRIDQYRRAGDQRLERREIQVAENLVGSRVLNRLGARVEAAGLEKIPDEPVLFVSNHQGYGDIFLFLGLVRNIQFGFVAKEELMKLPVFGKWIRRIRSIVLERGDARESLKVFQTGEEWLREGFSLVIFPEGTRSHSDEMAPFKKGSVRLATRTGIPIVPVSLMGAWRLFEENGYVQAADVKFYVHDPIPTAGLSKTELSGISDKVEAVISAKIDEWNEE
jgi:1-acyl-sn-glycerol-3-phosphate acyltransferase